MIDEQTLSEAIAGILQRAGIKANGHALNACDEAAKALVAQLKAMTENGTIRMKTQKEKVS
jgi:hypothetical protein